MNWRRGLIRAWVVVSVIWLLAFGAIGYQRGQKDAEGWVNVPASFSFECAKGDTKACEADYAKAGPAPISFRVAQSYLIAGVGAPLMVLILGVAGFWIAKGFSPKR